jgi:hypothetical protein
MTAARRQPPGTAAWRLRQARPRQAALLLALALAACSSPAGTTSNRHASASSPRLTVAATVDGHTSLPHRIHWQAFPSGPSRDVSEVDYLIDGRLRWVEHNAPYFYGGDGNYLVTSLLTPGTHMFTVRAIWADGRTATDTVRAQVSLAPAPPAALAGTWKRYLEQSGPSAPPSGYWRLVISNVGWEIYDTSGGGNLLDVAYLSPGLLEIRTGMFTSPGSQLDGNGWCNNEPGPTVRLRYVIHAKMLAFTPIGRRGCGGADYVTGSQWRGAWTWAGK